MGYMGFGMRKEVYKRKPKQAFKKLKKHNRRNAYKFPEKGTKIDRDFYIHTYHRPVYKRWWFILASLLTIATIGYTYMNTFVWSIERLEKQTTDFENEGILAFVNEYKAAVDSIVKFMESTDGGLSEIGRSAYSYHVYLRLMSRTQSDARTSHLRSEIDDRFTYWVEDGMIKYRRDDIDYDMKSEKWELRFALNNINSLDQSFVEHLGVSRQVLDHHLKTCFKNHWLVGLDTHGIKWQFYQYREYYEVLFLKEGVELTASEKSKMKELAPGVYWH